MCNYGLEGIFSAIIELRRFICGGAYKSRQVGNNMYRKRWGVDTDGAVLSS